MPMTCLVGRIGEYLIASEEENKLNFVHYNVELSIAYQNMHVEFC